MTEAQQAALHQLLSPETDYGSYLNHLKENTNLLQTLMRFKAERLHCELLTLVLERCRNAMKKENMDNESWFCLIGMTTSTLLSASQNVERNTSTVHQNGAQQTQNSFHCLPAFCGLHTVFTPAFKSLAPLLCFTPGAAPLTVLRGHSLSCIWSLHMDVQSDFAPLYCDPIYSIPVDRWCQAFFLDQSFTVRSEGEVVVNFFGSENVSDPSSITLYMDDMRALSRWAEAITLCVRLPLHLIALEVASLVGKTCGLSEIDPAKHFGSKKVPLLRKLSFLVFNLGYEGLDFLRINVSERTFELVVFVGDEEPVPKRIHKNGEVQRAIIAAHPITALSHHVGGLVAILRGSDIKGSRGADIECVALSILHRCCSVLGRAAVRVKDAGALGALLGVAPPQRTALWTTKFKRLVTMRYIYKDELKNDRVMHATCVTSQRAQPLSPVASEDEEIEEIEEVEEEVSMVDDDEDVPTFGPPPRRRRSSVTKPPVAPATVSAKPKKTADSTLPVLEKKTHKKKRRAHWLLSHRRDLDLNPPRGPCLWCDGACVVPCVACLPGDTTSSLLGPDSPSSTATTTTAAVSSPLSDVGHTVCLQCVGTHKDICPMCVLQNLPFLQCSQCHVPGYIHDGPHPPTTTTTTSSTASNASSPSISPALTSSPSPSRHPHRATTDSAKLAAKRPTGRSSTLGRSSTIGGQPPMASSHGSSSLHRLSCATTPLGQHQELMGGRSSLSLPRKGSLPGSNLPPQSAPASSWGSDDVEPVPLYKCNVCWLAAFCTHCARSSTRSRFHRAQCQEWEQVRTNALGRLIRLIESKIDAVSSPPENSRSTMLRHLVMSKSLYLRNLLDRSRDVVPGLQKGALKPIVQDDDILPDHLRARVRDLQAQFKRMRAGDDLDEMVATSVMAWTASSSGLYEDVHGQQQWSVADWRPSTVPHCLDGALARLCANYYVILSRSSISVFTGAAKLVVLEMFAGEKEYPVAVCRAALAAFAELSAVDEALLLAD